MFQQLKIEAFTLYETLSKKINPPESSFILGLAYDSLKCAKIIQGNTWLYWPAWNRKLELQKEPDRNSEQYFPFYQKTIQN